MWFLLDQDKVQILCLLLFYICFHSLLINTPLVSISYFVSVSLRKGSRGLEYRRSLFVCTCTCIFEVFRFHILLFAFLVVCIETFGFRGLFCNNGFKTDFSESFTPEVFCVLGKNLCKSLFFDKITPSRNANF